MKLSKAVDALKQAGVPARVHGGALKAGHGDMAGVKGLMVHHTAGSKTGNCPSLGVVVRGTGSLQGPLCNFLLARDGTWILIAAGRAYHAGLADDAPKMARKGLPSGNLYTIGVEVENQGDGSKLPVAQYESLIRGIRALQKYYGFKVIIGHSEWAPSRKIDPKFASMDQIRKDVARKPTAPAPQKAVGRVVNRLGNRLVVDGMLGPKTVVRLQRRLGMAETGTLNTGTVRALQKYMGVTVDGEIGPETRRALRARLGNHGSRDQVLYTDKVTIMLLQKALNKGVF